MSVTPQQFQEMERQVTKTRAPIPDPEGSQTAVRWPWLSVPWFAYQAVTFPFHGVPVGKPRMSQRDKWRKRPCVLRYRAFADALRAAAGPVPEGPEIVLVEARVAMPQSWSKKKKASFDGKPCRAKPDWDNIGKAVCDALFDEDCVVWFGLTVKRWCARGQEGLNVIVLYAKPLQNLT